MRPGGPMQPHKKSATDYTDNIRIYPCDLWLKFVRLLLTLDDLHARIELDIKLARVDLLVLFQTRQTHRRRIVILFDDLGLDRHAGRVNPNFGILVTRI